VRIQLTPALRILIAQAVSRSAEIASRARLAQGIRQTLVGDRRDVSRYNSDRHGPFRSIGRDTDLVLRSTPG
jgi:hypothetical protein